MLGIEDGIVLLDQPSPTLLIPLGDVGAILLNGVQLSGIVDFHENGADSVVGKSADIGDF